LKMARCSSKDALIRVWNRATFELHCTFRGHEGPVNAIGMEDGKVVSASGDGKMMLWEIPEETDASCATLIGPARIFEGNERGLACIEYKVGFGFFLILAFY
jgi:F-box and WD-40 domain protein 1/11